MVNTKMKIMKSKNKKLSILKEVARWLWYLLFTRWMSLVLNSSYFIFNPSTSSKMNGICSLTIGIKYGLIAFKSARSGQASLHTVGMQSPMLRGLDNCLLESTVTSM